jgi:8-oxo-dGTP diphosphatase
MALCRYVLGFCFDFGYHNVLLIEKSHPAWQAGKLNGIGGKIEEGESPSKAMAREFREETGGIEADFIPYGRLIAKNCEIWLFHSKIDEFPAGLHQKKIDDEFLIVLNRDDVSKWPVVPNVRVLLPMALNHARHLDKAQFLEIREFDQVPEEV